MLSLACVVVNDGSVVVAEMKDDKSVHALKEAIKEKAKYTFPADELTLILAKTDKGEWLHLSYDVLVKLRSQEKIVVVAAHLKNDPMTPEAPLNSGALGFGRDGAGEVGAIHVLVVVPAERWEVVRQAKKAKTTNALMTQPVAFTLSPASVLDPTTVADGTVQCTKALSTAFHSFGGFPATMLVRKEMQMVWTILCDNYIGKSPPDVLYALVGSPGVGKSALVLLFCCYLATHHGYNIYLARSLKCAGHCRSSNVVLWFRGSHVTGYPNCDHHDLNDLKKEFEAEHASTNNLIVCDGYHQAQLATVMDPFMSCDLFSTSSLYRQKSDDERELLLLPSWRRNQLQKLSEALGMNQFDERYAYSGGSVREFTRAFSTLENRSASMLRRLNERTEIALFGNYDAPTNEDLNSIRSSFTSDIATTDGYLKAVTWHVVVDSSVALKYLASKWRGDTISTMLQVAETLDNRSLYGQVFEVLVHKLAHDKSLELVLRDAQDNFGKCSHVKMTAGCSVKMGNDTDNFPFLTEAQKWAGCLTFLRKKSTKTMYWYPGYVHYRVIDSILIHKGVVYLLHITVASSTHSPGLGDARSNPRSTLRQQSHQGSQVQVCGRDASHDGVGQGQGQNERCSCIEWLASLGHVSCSHQNQV